MTPTLRVGYDCGPLLDPPTGVGRYASELADALERRGVQLNQYAVAWGGQPPAGVKRLRLPAKVAQWLWRHDRGPLGAASSLASVERATADREGDVDLVHATNFVLPALRSIPGVVTVHDLSFYRDDVFPGGERLRELVPWSVERAAKVIVPTAAIGEEVGNRYGIGSEKIAVTHEGVSPLFFGASRLSDTNLGRYGIPGPFIVAVGTIEPRKNLSRLLQAWERVHRELPDWRLVLAGPKGWGPDLPETPGVVLTGWVGDETLPGLYAAAEFFCYPSLYEGFGLPPLEAMAAGTPVLAGDYSAAPEVLGDAAVIVDALDPDALADGMRRLATDEALRRSLQVAGRARAANFTWDGTSKATVSAYRDVLEG
ncbi:MAG: glycosyltransferase family 4 protein [Actinomycetota bacterium]